MALLFLKVFSFMIYVLSPAFEPCVIVFFPSRLRHFQNMVFERINGFFWRQKSVSTQFVFDVGKQKKWLGAKSGRKGRYPINSMFWVLKYLVVWRDVSEYALSWWRMIRRRLFVFLISPKTSGKQMVMYHSWLTVLRCTNGTVATWLVFPKKQAIICFEVLWTRTTFVGFGLSWNTHTVDCFLLSGSYA